MTEHDKEPGNTAKVLHHFIREMTWPMLIAHGLITAFFFYGLTTSLIKLSGRDVAMIDFPIGPIIGALSGVLLIAIGAFLKLRLRD